MAEITDLEALQVRVSSLEQIVARLVARETRRAEQLRRVTANVQAAGALMAAVRDNGGDQ